MQSEVLSPQLLYLTFFHDAILIRSAVCKLGYQATLPSSHNPTSINNGFHMRYQELLLTSYYIHHLLPM